MTLFSIIFGQSETTSASQLITPSNASRSELQVNMWKAPEFSNPDDIVTFVIGPHESAEEFVVHKEHVCYYSPVMKTTFNSLFKEGQTKCYCLEDTEPNVFRLFVQWLYAQDYKVISGADTLEGVADSEHATEKERRLNEQDANMVGLWILGDKLMIPALQNAAMKTLKKLLPFRNSTAWIPAVYEGTIPGCQLRAFAVDYARAQLPAGWVAEHPEHFPQEALVELYTSMEASYNIWTTGVDTKTRFMTRCKGENVDYLVNELIKPRGNDT
ncbi:hypothetical protein V8E51_011724 [Hyaloscypha variabilis]